MTSKVSSVFLRKTELPTKKFEIFVKFHIFYMCLTLGGPERPAREGLATFAPLLRATC